MKSLIKRSLLVFAMFTLLGSNAMDNNMNLNDTHIVINGKLIDLTLKYTDGDLKVKIMDNSGTILYKDKFIGNKFSRKFDLTSLPKGNYHFEIEGQTRIITIPFAVSLSSVDFKKEEETIFHKPVIRCKENVVYISKLALKKEVMKIEVYDDNSNLIYTEDLNGILNLERKLNFSKLESGIYDLVVVSEGIVFKEKIDKK